MYRLLFIGAVAAVLTGVAAVQHGEGKTGEHILHHADAIEWAAGPPSLPADAAFVVLEGDPAEEGIFTMRLRLPDGYVIPPHTHPQVERVTVLSGTFLLGMDDSADPDATVRLPEGSYTSMPPGMVHYAIAEGQTTVQLTGVGPWEIHYINPEDDPRL
jgi:quercetin dioxygenase-like cupin family protein